MRGQAEPHVPPLVAFDPFGAFWLAGLQGAFATGAVMTLWAGLLRMTAPGAVTVNFPFGSGFTMNIHPSTNWGWVGATAKPDLEAEIVRTGVSYGRQLGRMMDLLLDVADKTPGADAGKRADLREIADKIDRIKRERNS